MGAFFHFIKIRKFTIIISLDGMSFIESFIYSRRICDPCTGMEFHLLCQGFDMFVGMMLSPL